MNTANTIKPVCWLGTTLITTPSRVPDHSNTKLIMMSLQWAQGTRNRVRIIGLQSFELVIQSMRKYFGVKSPTWLKKYAPCLLNQYAISLIRRQSTSLPYISWFRSKIMSISIFIKIYKTLSLTYYFHTIGRFWKTKIQSQPFLQSSPSKKVPQSLDSSEVWYMDLNIIEKLKQSKKHYQTDKQGYTACLNEESHLNNSLNHHKRLWERKKTKTKKGKQNKTKQKSIHTNKQKSLILFSFKWIAPQAYFHWSLHVLKGK